MNNMNKYLVIEINKSFIILSFIIIGLKKIILMHFMKRKIRHKRFKNFGCENKR